MSGDGNKKHQEKDIKRLKTKEIFTDPDLVNAFEEAVEIYQIAEAEKEALAEDICKWGFAEPGDVRQCVERYYRQRQKKKPSAEDT